MGRRNRRKPIKIKPVHIRIQTLPEPDGAKTTVSPRRGEVWFAILGDHTDTSVQSGDRPVLVVSNDRANERSEVVTIVPITSKLKKPTFPTHVSVCAHTCGNLQDSMILCEQITTVDKSVLETFMGRLPEEKMVQVEKAVKIQLQI